MGNAATRRVAAERAKSGGNMSSPRRRRRPASDWDPVSPRLQAHRGVLELSGGKYSLVEQRIDHLTAACLLILALLAVGAMLYFLRSVVIPFLVALVLMYLLQPIVNVLTKAPRRWCDKCFMRRGERCCESVRRLVHSERYNQYLAGKLMPLRESWSRSWTNSPWGSAENMDALAAGDKDDEDAVEEQIAEFDEERPLIRRGRVRRPVRASFQSRLTGACQDCIAFCLDKVIFPRWVAVFVALVVAVGILTALGMFVYSSISSFNWLKYELGAQRLTRRLAKLLALVDVNLNQDLVPFLVEKAKSLTPYVLQGIVNSFSSGAFVLIFLMYLLMTPISPPTGGTWGEIDTQIRRYILLKTMICTTVGFFVGIVFWLLCVDLAFMWALLTFFLQYIPNVGPIVATFLPMPLVILDPMLSIPAKFCAFILPATVHMIIGNIMEPRLFGREFEMHPIMVLIALAFWGVLWGIPGMVLSVPLMAVTRIICQDLDHPYARIAVRVMECRTFDDPGDSSLCSVDPERMDKTSEIPVRTETGLMTPSMDPIEQKVNSQGETSIGPSPRSDVSAYGSV